MRTVLLTLLALSMLAAQEVKPPKAPSETAKAEWYRLTRMQTQILAQQYRLEAEALQMKAMAESAKAAFEQFVKAEADKGCRIKEAEKGLECEAPAEAQKK